jgi:hypothetical protein
MPHSWVGVEFVNLVRQMVVDEDDGELHLLRGAPISWLSGEGIRVFGLPTHFGPFDMGARMKDRTLTLSLRDCPAAPEGIRIFWPRPDPPRSVRVDEVPVTGLERSSLLVKGRPRYVVAVW